MDASNSISAGFCTRQIPFGELKAFLQNPQLDLVPLHIVKEKEYG